MTWTWDSLFDYESHHCCHVPQPDWQLVVLSHETSFKMMLSVVRPRLSDVSVWSEPEKKVWTEKLDLGLTRKGVPESDQTELRFGLSLVWWTVPRIRYKKLQRAVIISRNWELEKRAAWRRKESSLITIWTEDTIFKKNWSEKKKKNLYKRQHFPCVSWKMRERGNERPGEQMTIDGEQDSTSQGLNKHQHQMHIVEYEEPYLVHNIKAQNNTFYLCQQTIVFIFLLAVGSTGCI